MGRFDHRDPIPVELACVFFVDVTYGQADQSGMVPEENDGWNQALKSELEAELGAELEVADIWPGASLPAFLLEISTSPLPYVAAVVAIFFSGKKVEENLDAWERLYSRFSRLLKKDVYLSRTAAAAFALSKIFEEMGGTPTSVRLTAYYSRDTRSPELETHDPVIQDEPRVEWQGQIQHCFIVEADNQLFKATVSGNKCAIENVTSTGI